MGIKVVPGQEIYRAEILKKGLRKRMIIGWC